MQYLTMYKYNQTKINEFLKVSARQKKSRETVRNRGWNLHVFSEYMNKPLECVMKKDIEAYADYLKDKRLAKATQDKYIITLRLFFKWYKPESEDMFKDIGLWSEKPSHAGKEWVEREDVIKMLPHCKTQRDRAFIMLLWDSAGRIDEVLGVKIGHLKFEDKFCRVTLNGKTGERTIPVTDCLPDLQAWVNMCHGKKDDWLFPSQKGGRLQPHWGHQYLRQISKKAGIDKNVHPHSFRHGRLTELGNQGVPEMKLRLFAGWTRNSPMPEIYVNTTMKDMEREILSNAGIETEEAKKKPVIDMSPKNCPRCGTSNAFDSKYCKNCSLIIDTKTAIEFESEKTNLADDLLNLEMEDLEVLIKIKERMNKNKQNNV